MAPARVVRPARVQDTDVPPSYDNIFATITVDATALHGPS